MDRHLAEGLEDMRKGRTHGPYSDADAAIAALDARVVIRKAFGKQLPFLLANRGHPSLRAKKYNEALDI